MAFSREPLAGDVGHHHVNAVVGAPQDVVEVSRHHSGGQTPCGHVPTRPTHLRRRQQPSLHVARHLQLAPSELLRHQCFELQPLHHLAATIGRELGHADLARRDAAQQPVVDQQLVGGLDRRRRHTVLPRHLPVTSEGLSFRQVAAGDPVPQLADDLLAQRLRVAGDEVEHQGKCITVHKRYIQSRREKVSKKSPNHRHVPPARVSERPFPQRSHPCPYRLIGPHDTA